jgi:hypothetical protein
VLKVPIAMNCEGSPIDVRVGAVGITVMAVSEFAGRLEAFVSDTVDTIPLRLAVIDVVPAPVMVAKPVESIVATATAFDTQST